MQRIFLIGFLLVFSVSHAQGKKCNCCSENHKAFDFWIGDWEVTHFSKGTPAGRSTVRKEEGGCVIRENWTSATAGYTGTSLNFYNTASDQWEQVWVDNAGVVLKLKGHRTGNQMILVSDEFKKEDGKMYRNRITWTKHSDGTVRQLWEVLQGEEAISVAFDGLYTPIQK